MRLKFALVIFCCLTYLLISFGSDGIGLLVEGGIGGTGISAEAIPVLACATVNGAKIDSINTVINIDRKQG